MKCDLRKTSIICTIGPASEDNLDEMIKLGMNLARVNFSHGGKLEQCDKVEKIKAARKRANAPIGLVLDTQGPEIRIGKFKEGLSKVLLKEGDEIILTNDGRLADGKYFDISYKNLYQDIEIGGVILIDDGLIKLRVTNILNSNIIARVEVGGELSQRKSINVPGTKLKLPSITEKDIEDLKYAVEGNFDYIAASFVRSVDDILAIRKVLEENGGKDIKIIAKIECLEGLQNIKEIINYADGVMIARGDFAVEVPFVEVPLYQKMIIKLANEKGKPVIVATQMLDSMTNKPTPTRAEASDVANAVYDRASGIMLSGETALGKYPFECVKTMDKIARNVEKNINYWNIKVEQNFDTLTIEDKTSNIAKNSAKLFNVQAIVAYTHSGSSIMKLAGLAPGCPIIAVTDNEKTYNQLSLAWDTMPILVKHLDNINSMIESAIKELKEKKILESGDIIYVTGGKNYLNEVTSSKRIGTIAIV